MANVLIDDGSMTAIANAIRTKKGVSTEYKPSEMAEATLGIDTGGITPSGTLTITENGTYDVTNYANALINITPPDNRLYDWDLTQSLTDSKSGKTVTLPSEATQSSSGVVITAIPASPITFATLSASTHKKLTIEWDITTYTVPTGSAQYGFGYVARAKSQLQGVLFHGTNGWRLRDTAGTYYNTGNTNSDLFKGHTMKLQINYTANTWALYCDDTLVYSCTVGNNTGNLVIGLRSTGTYTGLRIYEGIV